MNAPDTVTERLVVVAPEATARLRALFDAHPEADHVVVEYLLGLDHAVLAYARDVDGADLAPHATVVFAGFQDLIADLEPEGPVAVSAFRHDEAIADAVADWFDTCWRAAGGEDRLAPTYWTLEGDDGRYNLQTGEYD